MVTLALHAALGGTSPRTGRASPDLALRAADGNAYMIPHPPSLVALDRRAVAIQGRQLNAAKADAPVTGYGGTPAYANHSHYAPDLGRTLVALPVP